MSDLNTAIDQLMAISGSGAAAIVDYKSGMLLADRGNMVDLTIAAAGNTEVVRAKLRTMKDLGIDGSIEDILITLDTQYHIIRPSKTNQGLFIYFVLDSEVGNLALARRKVAEIDKALVV
jgi:hypothetical protein